MATVNLQVPVCVRENGQCVPQWFPPAANEIVKEVEAAPNQDEAIFGDKLPFIVSGAKEVQVVPMDEQRVRIQLPSLFALK